MSKLYKLKTCENLIDRYIHEYQGNIEQLEEGVLGLGKILLYGAEGKKTILITEVFINAWTSLHKIRMYNKLPKKYQNQINENTGNKIAAYFNYIGSIELKKQIWYCIPRQGAADKAIEALLTMPEVREELKDINPDKLRTELREYGAWDDEDLEDHETNLARILWIAAGNLFEEEVI